ncbi:MAG TPA: endonuclease/exonuclease/phosphatase family protein [Candidatus Sumerlaeota bacterium]|nr:endonuclease/exonuclease/phosphatase family protein [Candidatus Sumerlaeota bacterium]
MSAKWWRSAALFALLVLLVGCATANKEGARHDGPLRVVTYNIRGGMGTGDKSRPPVKAGDQIPLIADFLREESADFVFLQEVDQNVQRSGSIDETALLAKSLNFHGQFAPAIPLQGGHFGVAILSRWPIVDSRVEPLFKPDYSAHVPRYPDYYEEQRVLLIVHVDTPRGRVALLCTHLGLTADQREKQFAQIAEFARQEAKSLPVIFAGDLNTKPDEAELRLLDGVLKDTAAGSTTRLNTFPWDVPNRCIDYVYTTAEFATTRVVVPDVLLSDHRPVFVELQGPASR